MAKRKTTKESAEEAEKITVETPVKEEKQKETKVEEKAEAKKKRASPKKQITVSARRKMAIARASIKAGKGVVKINKVNLQAIDNPHVKMMVSEPLKIAGDYATQADINVNVNGGGQMGQAQAVRSAIAKSLVAYTKDPQLKKELLAYDRFLLVDDSRQVEPKKFKGRKARARFQKSYR